MVFPQFRKIKTLTPIQRKIINKVNKDSHYSQEFATANRLLAAFEQKRKPASSIYNGLKVKKVRTPNKKK